MAKTTILGAGLSGMVAAINLAKEGREVLVLDAAKKIGGMMNYHPSLHVTPFAKPFIWDYIGMNLENYARPISEKSLFYIGRHAYPMPQDDLCMVERGARKTSIDSVLFEQAKAAGVKFEFSNFIKKPLVDLPPGSIIACGLFKDTYEASGVPYREVVGWAATDETKDKSRDCLAHLWYGDFSSDYAYACTMNGLVYVLLFNRNALTKKNLADFRKVIKETEGYDYEKWEPTTGAVPVAKPSNPRLFVGDKILAGTIAGMMDPVFLYGIHGAILSGKVAALAVTNKDRAMKDFRKFTKYFRRAYYVSRYSELSRPSLDSLRKVIKRPRLYTPFLYFAGGSVPGYRKNWMTVAMKHIAGMEGEVK
jgi:flavin-dependent dehydrogenase